MPDSFSPMKFLDIILDNKTYQVTRRVQLENSCSSSVPCVPGVHMIIMTRQTSIYACSIWIYTQQNYWGDSRLSERRQQRFWNYHTDYTGENRGYQSTHKAERKNVPFPSMRLPSWFRAKIPYGVVRTLNIASRSFYAIHPRQWLLSCNQFVSF